MLMDNEKLENERILFLEREKERIEKEKIAENKKIECLYSMKLGEELRDFDAIGSGREGRVNVLRVPGGWIFTTYCECHPSSCFVGWDNEFQPNVKIQAS